MIVDVIWIPYLDGGQNIIPAIESEILKCVKSRCKVTFYTYLLLFCTMMKSYTSWSRVALSYFPPPSSTTACSLLSFLACAF